MRLRAFLLWLPALVLAGAFAAIWIHFSSLSQSVHEDGRHTLLTTIFYFQHAAGELPADLLLSAAVAGAMLYCAGPARVSPRGALAAALAIDGLIVIGSIVSAGPTATLQWIAQFHTRDTEPLVFGSHWGYHFLSEAALMLLAMALAGALGNRPGSPRLLVACWIGFAVLSAAFGVGRAPFTDARYLGHEARETLTYALTAIPLAVAACSLLADPGPARRSPPRYALISFAGFLALAAYQAAGAIAGGVRQHAQSTDPVRLIGTHFFEHTLGLLVVTSHSCLFYAWTARRGKA
jgi:hypothetical protein